MPTPRARQGFRLEEGVEERANWRGLDHQQDGQHEERNQ
jgi:hypothetical protein